MHLVRAPLAALLIAALAPFAAAAAETLPRDTVVPASAVAQVFPEVTKEAGTEPNQTSVGNATASIPVIFTSPDGRKKITLSVDQYASAADAAAAFATAVKASEVAPGDKQAETPDPGEEALAGSS